MTSSRYQSSVYLKSKTALFKCMQQKSFDSVSIKDICEAADFSRQYFYRFYLDKVDLVQDIFLEDLTATFGSFFNLKDHFKNLLIKLQKKATFYKELFISAHTHEFFKLFMQAEKIIFLSLTRTSLFYTLSDEQELSLDFYIRGVISTLIEYIINNITIDENALTSNFLLNLPPHIAFLNKEDATGDFIQYQLYKNLTPIK